MATIDHRTEVSSEVERRDVLQFRFQRHDLHRAAGSVSDPADMALLDYGVQDTGPDGAAWALACRGTDRSDLGDDLVLAWTLRGAPHAYRRTDLASIAVAVSPFDESDAAKRIFDAAKPLRDSGRSILDAMATVSTLMEEVVSGADGGAMTKGELSSALVDRVDPTLLRWCRPCQATHLYEQTFRLSALQAALELTPATAPPVMSRSEGLGTLHWSTRGSDALDRHHVVRNYLRFYGPATPSQAAAFLDSPLKVIRAHWPADTVTVGVADEPDRASAQLLTQDFDEVTTAAPLPSATVRLLGPYDPYLQLRDRELLVPDEARRKDLWRVLGRPGAIVVDGDVVGTWRPKSAGRKLNVVIDPWRKLSKPLRAEVEHQAERLAAHRGVTLATVADAD